MPVRIGPSYPLKAGRRDWQLTIKAFGTRERVASVKEMTVPGPDGPVAVRVYTPKGGSVPRPVLAWFHGGGFIVGDLYTSGGTCRALANRSGAVVVNVDYRLAPEHDLLAGRADCLAVVEWLAEHAAEIGGDPQRIAIGGDSAGGSIAAAVAQECARRGTVSPVLQVLAYPATDLDGEYPSNLENADGYLLTQERIEWFRHHISAVADIADPALSPLHTADLSGLAPALVLTAGYDPIRDEGLAYAERLREAGVPVEALHYPGQIHGFLSLDRVIAGARDALHHIGSSLTVAFGGEPLSSRRPERNRVVRMVDQRVNESVVTGLAVQDQLRRTAVSLLSRSWRP